MNETEAELLAGSSDLQKCGEMLRKKCGRVIITLGKDGALLWEKEGPEVKVDCPRVEVEKVVDTTGAGDAFVGGFLAQYCQGRDLETGVRCGIWAATHIIQRSGCTFDTNKKFQ